MDIFSKNRDVSMQRGRAMLFSGEIFGILMPRYQVMHISRKNHGVSMHRGQEMLQSGEIVLCQFRGVG